MGPTRQGMRAVELVEADGSEATAVPAAPAARRPDRPGPPDRRRARPWAVAAVLAAALVVGAGAVASERREAVRLAAVADLPGVLEPIGSPLTEVWRSEHRLWSPLREVGGVLVGVTDVRDASRDVVVVGLDAGTGEERWITTVVPAATTPIGGVRCVVPDAPAGGTDEDRVVVCVSIDALGPHPQDLSRLEPRRARLLVLAPDTGEMLEERVVDRMSSVAALGADVVLKEVDEDGRVRVTRTAPRGGEPRWTFTGPPSSARADYSVVGVDDGLVVVPGEAGWVLDGDGGVVHAWEAGRPAAARWADVLHGRVLVQPMRDLVGTTVVDLASGESFVTDGYPVDPSADDGSTGDLVLVQSAQGDGLVAHDLGSGRPVWTVRGEDAGGVVVLDDRVVRAESGALRAVDARTGRTLWTAAGAAARQYGVHTDGRLVVRTERDAERRTVLVGRGLDDGRVRWTTDVADDLQQIVSADGRLYGLTPDGMVAFGPGDE